MKYLIYVSAAVGIASGLLLPQAGELTECIPYLIGLLLLLNFLDVRTQWNKLLRKELLVTLLLSAVVMPAVSYYILSAVFIEPYRIGLVLVACSPSGVLTLILYRFIPDSDYNLIFSNFLFTTFGSIFYIPLILMLLIPRSGSVQINTGDVLLQTAGLVLIPYFAGRFLRMVFNEDALSSIKKASRWIIVFLIYGIVTVSISSTSYELVWNTSLIGLSVVVFSIYIMQGGLGYAIGYVIGDRSIRHTLALISSSRNTQIVLAIAVLNFSSLVVVPCVIGVIFHHVTNALWLWLFRK